VDLISDPLPFSVAKFEELLDQIFGSEKKILLLDVGTGNGLWIRQVLKKARLAARIEKVVGIDSKLKSPAADQAGKVFHVGETEVAFYSEPIEAFEPGEKFDVIVMNAPNNELFDEFPQSLLKHAKDRAVMVLAFNIKNVREPGHVRGKFRKPKWEALEARINRKLDILREHGFLVHVRQGLPEYRFPDYPSGSKPLANPIIAVRMGSESAAAGFGATGEESVQHTAKGKRPASVSSVADFREAVGQFIAKLVEKSDMSWNEIKRAAGLWQRRPLEPILRGKKLTDDDIERLSNVIYSGKNIVNAVRTSLGIRGAIYSLREFDRRITLEIHKLKGDDSLRDFAKKVGMKATRLQQLLYGMYVNDESLALLDQKLGVHTVERVVKDRSPPTFRKVRRIIVLKWKIGDEIRYRLKGRKGIKSRKAVLSRDVLRRMMFGQSLTVENLKAFDAMFPNGPPVVAAALERLGAKRSVTTRTDINRRIGLILRKMRGRKGTKAVAKKTGLSSSDISRMEQGLFITDEGLMKYEEAWPGRYPVEEMLADADAPDFNKIGSLLMLRWRVGDRLRALRVLSQLNTHQAAAMLGVSPGTYVEMEGGVAKLLDDEMLDKIAIKFNKGESLLVDVMKQYGAALPVRRWRDVELLIAEKIKERRGRRLKTKVARRARIGRSNYRLMEREGRFIAPDNLNRLKWALGGRDIVEDIFHQSPPSVMRTQRLIEKLQDAKTRTSQDEVRIEIGRAYMSLIREIVEEISAKESFGDVSANFGDRISWALDGLKATAEQATDPYVLFDRIAPSAIRSAIVHRGDVSKIPSFAELDRATWKHPLRRSGFGAGWSSGGRSGAAKTNVLSLWKIRKVTWDRHFIKATRYFNTEVLGSPLTWEKVIDLYELLRGDRKIRAYTDEVRAERLRSVREFLPRQSEIQRLMEWVQDSRPEAESKLRTFVEELPERRRSAIKNYANFLSEGRLDEVVDIIHTANLRLHDEGEIMAHAATLYTYIGGEIFLGLPGFRVIKPLGSRDRPNPASGHHRLAWFIMNYFLIQNEFKPVYFTKRYAKLLGGIDQIAKRQIVTRLIGEQAKPAGFGTVREMISWAKKYAAAKARYAQAKVIKGAARFGVKLTDEDLKAYALLFPWLMLSRGVVGPIWYLVALPLWAALWFRLGPGWASLVGLGTAALAGGVVRGVFVIGYFKKSYPRVNFTVLRLFSWIPFFSSTSRMYLAQFLWLRWKQSAGKTRSEHGTKDRGPMTTEFGAEARSWMDAAGILHKVYRDVYDATPPEKVLSYLATQQTSTGTFRSSSLYEIVEIFDQARLGPGSDTLVVGPGIQLLVLGGGDGRVGLLAALRGVRVTIVESEKHLHDLAKKSTCPSCRNGNYLTQSSRANPWEFPRGKERARPPDKETYRRSRCALLHPPRQQG